MRTLTLLAAALAVSCAAMAQRTAESVMASMSSAVAELGGYELRFRIDGEGIEASDGALLADGDRYLLTLGEQRQWGDGHSIWQVDPAARQVVIDPADQGSDFLMNPTGALSFAASEFTMRLASDDGKTAVVVLLPKDGSETLSSVTVSVDLASRLPSGLRYDYQGMELGFDVLSIRSAQLSGDPRLSFRASDWSGFEILDFRK